MLFALAPVPRLLAATHLAPTLRPLWLISSLLLTVTYSTRLCQLLALLQLCWC
jgi:hypothetical protein